MQIAPVEKPIGIAIEFVSVLLEHMQAILDIDSRKSQKEASK